MVITMTTLKSVKITGNVPDNVWSYPDMWPFLTYAARPDTNLKIEYSHVTHAGVDEAGRRVPYYAFGLTGQDRVENEWLDDFMTQVRKIGGSVYRCVVNDFDM